MRFAHLLQPIRDLTKNWEVDVAAQLGEYLEEVRAAGEWHRPGDSGGIATPRLQVCSGLVFHSLVLFLPSPPNPSCLSKPSVRLSWSCHFQVCLLAGCEIYLVG